MSEGLMRRSPVAPQDCHLARSFDLLGDRWLLLLLRAGLYGVRRFEDFQAELAIPRTVLSDRLKRLVAGGLMARKTYREVGERTRLEYHLTSRARALRLPFVALTQWSDAWLAPDEAPPMRLRSRKTGEALRIALVNRAGEAVAAEEIAMEFDSQPRRADGEEPPIARV